MYSPAVSHANALCGVLTRCVFTALIEQVCWYPTTDAAVLCYALQVQASCLEKFGHAADKGMPASTQDYRIPGAGSAPGAVLAMGGQQSCQQS
jgi:hypothetical protein